MADIKSLVSDVVAAPLGEVIASVGQGVADAQHALDEGSLAAVLGIYAESGDAKLRLLQEIGYRPTFYALPETTGEVRVTLRLGQGAAGQGTGTAVRKAAVPEIQAVPVRTGLNARIGNRLYATPVDAGYSNRFGYSADVSAKLTFKIVPVPAPEGADELRLVPDLAGRTAAEARAALEALGLAAAFSAGDGVVVADVPAAAEVAGQAPAAQSVLRLGDEVRLTLASS